MPQAEGLQVTLSSIPGITDKKLLKTPYYFQCPPLESFKIVHAHEHTDYQTISGVTYSRRNTKQLRTITFQTLAVSWGSFTTSPDNWDKYDFSMLTQRLVHLCEYGTPFLLQTSNGNEDTNLTMKATLRQFDLEERAGEPDARYFDVSFVEWRDAYVARRAPTKWPKHHKLQGSTTIKGLAKKYYGKPSLSYHIAKANKIRHWGYSTPLVKMKRYKVGDKITIPAPPKATTTGL